MILILALLHYTIAGVDIDARWTDAKLITDVSGLQIGNELQKNDIEKAIENLTRLKLFNFINVDTSIVGDGVFITIHVTEAPFLKHNPEFIGNKKFSRKTLINAIELKEGQVANEQTISNARFKILNMYEEKLYYKTTVRDSLNVDSLNKAELLFLIEEGTIPKVGKIQISGNNSIPDSKIKRKMKTKERGFLRSGKLDMEKLDEDLVRVADFYKEKGFLEIKVDEPVIDVIDDRFVITITVTENSIYYVGGITYNGNEVFNEEQLRRLCLIKSNDVYNLKKANETLQEFMVAYADEGYIYCSIVPNENVRDSIIDIEYVIKESSPADINRVIITGNRNTREKVIRREIVTIPGLRFRRSQVLRSMREIANLGFFENIEPATGAPDDSGNIDLIYYVTEKQGVATVGAGISYSAQDKLTGYFELSHPNMFGRAQRLYTKFEIGGRLTNYQIGYTEPWLFDTRTSTGIDLYYTNRFWDYYTKRDIGFAGRVTFPFYLDYTRFNYSLRTERTQILNISSSYNPPSSGYSLYDDTIPKWTMANSFGLTRDSRDFIFNPSSGTYLSLQTEFAKKFLFTNIDYNRVTFEARAYYPIFWKFVLMGRIKAGIVTSVDEVPFYKRFYAGGVGDDGVRGYSDRSLSPVVDGRTVGGNAILINNLELKLKLSSSLAFLLFYDAGNSFPSYKDINMHELYRGIGAGVRLEIPMVGVLGFDLGYGLDREHKGLEPHFQINPFGMF
ncbi:outer membrane protein assembly factor BamA [candidate division WOR-3 bacterium RBG_13_43_14]|uniref:Outer membrane protein assembly factor BamA n=1 Tax=candidate division WOR-3 bacterium RBG_13_43_14 TaxID=1802590 RepID=A0A1F4U893_UNCW3|nr:MAG: outer membrane protein assembly factor BamA [candidate division WOR-3 bacterium RBG_13_43_14]